VNTPAEAVAAANFVYDPPSSNYPAVVLPPNAPTGPADAFQNAFKHNLYGSWTTVTPTSPGDRITISEAQEGNPSVSSGIVNIRVKNGDSPGRTEVWNQESTNLLQDNDTADLNFEVSFPSDFPAVPTTRYVGVARLSAFTNGLPPLEVLVKANGSGVDTVWLRENGSEHDLASQSTLDAAGGYLWSTPLVRSVGYPNLNWLKLTIRVKFSTNPAVGWIELYQNYNMSTPVMARTFKKTLSDTTGTVRDYFRTGINRHSNITGDMRVMFNNVWCRIVRPP
jgi:hypothetical protein